MNKSHLNSMKLFMLFYFDEIFKIKSVGGECHQNKIKIAFFFKWNFKWWDFCKVCPPDGAAFPSFFPVVAPVSSLETSCFSSPPCGTKIKLILWKWMRSAREFHANSIHVWRINEQRLIRWKMEIILIKILESIVWHHKL